MTTLSEHAVPLSVIRDFLRKEGCAPPPWCSSDQVLTRLHAVLRERRNKDGFWNGLKELASRIEAEHRNPVLRPEFNVLGAYLTQQVLDELRASLTPPEGQSGSLAEWMGSKLSARAATAFVTFCALLTPGCGSHSPDTCDELAHKYFVQEQDKAVLCDLQAVVAQASVADDVKQQVLACLAQDSAEARVAYLQQWQQMSPESLGATLALQANYCDADDADYYDDDSGH